MTTKEEHQLIPLPGGENLRLLAPDDPEDDWIISGDLRATFNPGHDFTNDPYGFEVDGNYGAEEEVKERAKVWGCAVTFDSEQSMFAAYARQEADAWHLIDLIVTMAREKNADW